MLFFFKEIRAMLFPTRRKTKIMCNAETVFFNLQNKNKKWVFFFGGGRGSNPGPYIFYALFIPTELSSRRQKKKGV